MAANLDLNEVLTSAEEESGIGYCLACGFQQDYVEPDAEGYTCEDCEEPQVMGAENILLNGFV